MMNCHGCGATTALGQCFCVWCKAPLEGAEPVSDYFDIEWDEWAPPRAIRVALAGALIAVSFASIRDAGRGDESIIVGVLRAEAQVAAMPAPPVGFRMTAGENVYYRGHFGYDDPIPAQGSHRHLFFGNNRTAYWRPAIIRVEP
jgi:hypothetical protein